ncbi:MAG: CD225/dispanin family protein [Candidatus Sulfotelmatobacter sp.]
MFCSQCGANNADSAAVCVQCGRNLQQAPLPGQPLAPAPQASAVYVQNYLVFAILATVLCCLPAGIPAIIYAAQVNGKLQAGDIAGAQAASNNAKMWCWISFGLGLAFCFIYGLIMVAGIMRHMNR